MIDADLSMREFEEISKRAFVSAASSRAVRRNGTVNRSRVAAITGLSRAEVTALFVGDSLTLQRSQKSRAGRVIDGWTNDPRFRTRVGAPRVLPLVAGPNSFAELVRLYAGDIPPKAILDRLQQLQLVNIQPETLGSRARVHLVRKAPTSRMTSQLISVVEHLANALRTTASGHPTTVSSVRLRAKDQPQLAAIARAALERQEVFLSGLESSFPATADASAELEIVVGISQIGPVLGGETNSGIRPDHANRTTRLRKKYDGKAAQRNVAK